MVYTWFYYAFNIITKIDLEFVDRQYEMLRCSWKTSEWSNYENNNTKTKKISIFAQLFLEQNLIFIHFSKKSTKHKYHWKNLNKRPMNKFGYKLDRNTDKLKLLQKISQFFVCCKIAKRVSWKCKTSFFVFKCWIYKSWRK